MKKSLIALSGMAVFLTCSSIAATAAPLPAHLQQNAAAPVLLADAAKPAAKDEAKSKDDAAKPVLTPVKVSVKSTEQNIEIEISGKAAVLGGYNASQQKRTITIPQASLAGPEQNIDLEKGLIRNVQVHELDGGKVVIDIYALSNPRIVQQAQGKKFLVSLNDMEDAAKPKAAAKPAAASAPVKVKKEAAASKNESKPAAAAAPAKSKDKAAASKPEAKPAAAPAQAKQADKTSDKKTEAKASDNSQPAAADKEAAAEPIPVTVKVNNGPESVSFDVNWTGDVKVKEFPYNPGKGIHTFVFSPAVLSAPEGLVAVNKGTLQAVRTRQLDKQTVAVDVMASSAPNIKAQPRQTAGASYTVRAAGTPAAAKPAPSAAQKKTEAKPAAKAAEPQNAPQAAVPEPVPVSLKVNTDVDKADVSFDIEWEKGDVKVKAIPYNPAKSMSTFILHPAVLAGPEESIKVNLGMVQTIRTRRVDSKTVAVDVMAYNEPTIQTVARTAPGASFLIDTDDMTNVIKHDSGMPPKAPDAAKPAAAPSAASSSQTPAAAPKASSNVGAESGTAAKAGELLPSERVCDYFTMAGRDVQSLVNSMKGLFPNVRFQADPVLNVILVEGPAKDIEEVRKLINIQ